ncbi:3855_t:CDS:2 [Paraglomus occultum]|uniref:3855_t:CDS:1 n=1 Tax=Paraglomus occultum TaxID=144539 RepID=A0A9N9B2X2_9GLOM|nr:3855_t:CDS:2 [Paraglomus occultum]
MPDELTPKRQRVSKACDTCRRKKVRCDGVQPPCGNCATFGFECTYNDATKKRGPPKGYIEAIETRLHRMESLLGGLVHSNDPRAEAVLSELMQDDLRPLRHPGSTDTSLWRNLQSSGSTDNFSSVDDSYRSGESPLMDDLNDIMGILSIDENNQVRYHGRSSGFYLLKKSKCYKDGVLQYRAKGELVASTVEFELVKRPELIELPSEELSNHLLECYFTQMHPYLPLIYKPAFFKQLKEKKYLPLLLLNAIYSFAAKFSPKLEVRKDPSKPETAGDVFFERAKTLLDSDYGVSKVTTVQALLIMSIREFGCGKTSRGWLYSGMAIRMAQDLGIHRNNERWHPLNLSHEERESQRRTFWTCFVLDRLASAYLGRPMGIDEKDVDAAHPSEAEYDETEMLPFKMDGLYSSTSSPLSSQNSVQGSPETSSKSASSVGSQSNEVTHRSHAISRFIHFIKLCEIIGRIVHNIHAIRCKPISKMDDTVRSILDSSLTSWFVSLPPHLQYDPNSNDCTSPATLALHMNYYTVLNLLHRPYAPTYAHSHNVCTTAAEEVAKIAETLMKKAPESYSLAMSIYSIFTGGVTHTYNACQDNQSLALSAKVNLLKCLRALDSAKDVWQPASRYYNLLVDLVDLTDAKFSNDNVRSSLEDSEEDHAPQSRKRVNASTYQNQAGNSQLALEDYNLVYPPYLTTTDSSSNNSIQVKSERHQMAHNSIRPQSTPEFTMTSEITSTLEESPQMYSSLPIRHPRSVVPSQQLSSLSINDPFATPGAATAGANNNGNGVFNASIASGYWEIPPSADLEEWTAYVNNQHLRQSGGITYASQGLQSTRMQTSNTNGIFASQQRLMSNDGNNINMYGNGNQLMPNILTLQNGEGRSAGGYSGNGGNGANDSTVPLIYY